MEDTILNEDALNAPEETLKLEEEEGCDHQWIILLVLLLFGVLIW